MELGRDGVSGGMENTAKIFTAKLEYGVVRKRESAVLVSGGSLIHVYTPTYAPRAV